MLTTEIALHAEEPFAGLAILSGTLVSADRWAEAARARGASIHALQAHGRRDPLLPFAAAEALRDLVSQLPRGLQVALFNIEEWALLGSAAHLAALPESERARRVLNVNLDSVAGAEGLTALTSGVPGIAGFLRAVLAPAGLSLPVAEPFFGNSDHANFLRHGIPALRLAAGYDLPQSNLRFLLTPADTADKVRPEQLKYAASVAALLVLAACAGPAPPAPRMDAETARRVTNLPP
jgi:Zn-dependent M28 family amino/carboxypeptidase